MKKRSASKKDIHEVGWTPVRNGDIYCSPLCGMGCTHEAFLTAHNRANLLCKRLDRTTKIKGWTKRVWENLGWHYSAISPCGRIKLHTHHFAANKVHKAFISYTAFLGDKDSSGGTWAEHGDTPAEAVKKVIAVAKAQLAKIDAVLNGL